MGANKPIGVSVPSACQVWYCIYVNKIFWVWVWIWSTCNGPLGLPMNMTKLNPICRYHKKRVGEVRPVGCRMIVWMVCCRLCKEPDHVPLRCEEVEQQNETRVRTQLELRMTEAMLRTCPRCKKRFFKVEGCNKMTCTCGQSMCYICRKPVKGYDHFQKGR